MTLLYFYPELIFENVHLLYLYIFSLPVGTLCAYSVRIGAPSHGRDQHTNSLYGLLLIFYNSRVENFALHQYFPVNRSPFIPSWALLKPVTPLMSNTVDMIRIEKIRFTSRTSGQVDTS